VIAPVGSTTRARRYIPSHGSGNWSAGIRGILTDPGAPTAKARGARHAEPVVSIVINRTPFGKIPLNIGNISGRSSA